MWRTSSRKSARVTPSVFPTIAATFAFSRNLNRQAMAYTSKW